MISKKERVKPIEVGDKYTTNENYELEVLEYNNSKDVVVCFENRQPFTTNARAVRLGSIKNPNKPVVAKPEKVSTRRKAITYPVDILRELLDYNPLTGELKWKKRPLVSDLWSSASASTFNTKFAGRIAGYTKKVQNRDYLRMEVKLPDGKSYLVHRVIWAWVTGEWPVELIDHIDQDPLNNKWENLRQADYHNNQQNVRLRSDNSVGFVGVYWSVSNNTWIAQTTYKGEKLIENCDTLLDAVATRLRQQRKFGFSDNHGVKK